MSSSQIRQHKLRFYCSICKKQCIDSNGFKNHIETDKHQQLMAVFLKNTSGYISKNSKDFERSFLSLLSRRYGSRRVWANRVYQEYIVRKDHIHMNSTKWSSLAGFVRSLTTRGMVTSEETPRGWFICYIDPFSEQQEERLKAMEVAPSIDSSTIHQLRVQVHVASTAGEKKKKAVCGEGITSGTIKLISKKRKKKKPRVKM
eukprot:gnl/Dysnectes_brevis/4512_a6093_578.p1 GENE.gnl/Dysnectes_brevis/4512_a6093_578~~gnl/Dysnectes_brevis/4512_a6093_578.p1  ORF type:complete len:216 (-),score=12.09 gnl/Dysnectes_brevis/4512_a6093_578:685-1290(-)